MFISGGENVYPVQVEEVLNEHPLVGDSTVVRLPDDRWGEVVVAYVRPTEPGLTASECDKHCLAHPMLADFERPRAYRFVVDAFASGAPSFRNELEKAPGERLELST